MIKNLERLNSWLISRKKKTHNDAEKYKEIERKDELKELAKKIITTDILEPKETENKNLNDYNKEIERIVKDIARISKEIAHDLELEFGERDDDNKPFETLVMMHKFGYEVEKEKLYTAKLKLTGEYLIYDKGYKEIRHTKVPDDVAHKVESYHFTEDDLAKYHAWSNDAYQVKEVN